MQSSLPILSLAIIVFAGCAGTPASTQEEPGLEPTEPPIVEASSFGAEIPWDGSVAGAGPVFGADIDYFIDGARGGAFEVPGDADAFVAEAQGTCASGPACSFRFALFHGDEERAQTRGVLPLVLKVDDPSAGTWEAHLFMDSAGSAMVQASGMIIVNGTSS